MFLKGHFSHCAENRLQAARVEAGRPVWEASALIQLKHDGGLAKVVAVEVLEMVRFWIYVTVRTMGVLMYGIPNKRGPVIKRMGT